METITESRLRSICITIHRAIFSSTYINNNVTFNISVNHFESYEGDERVRSVPFLVTNKSMDLEQKLELTLDGSEDVLSFWIKKQDINYSNSRSKVINVSEFFKQCSEGTKYWVPLTYGANNISKLEFSFSEEGQ